MEAIITENDVIEQIVAKLISQEMALSYSALSNFADSPKSFIEYKLKKKVQTDAMLYGQMVHCLILEPDDFDKRFFTFDDTEKVEQIGGGNPRATKEYKQWKAEQVACAGELVVISPQDFKAAKKAANDVKFNKASAWILHNCTLREQKIDWEFKNFKWHGFIDAIEPNEHGNFLNTSGIMCDLKSCADAEPKKFQRDIINMKYYLQAAMYLMGAGPRDYYIIAFDKNGGISVHKLHKDLIEYGMDEYDKLMGKFNECILLDKWNESFDFWSNKFRGYFDAERPAWLYNYK